MPQQTGENPEPSQVVIRRVKAIVHVKQEDGDNEIFDGERSESESTSEPTSRSGPIPVAAYTTASQVGSRKRPTRRTVQSDEDDYIEDGDDGDDGEDDDELMMGAEVWIIICSGFQVSSEFQHRIIARNSMARSQSILIFPSAKVMMATLLAF
jgi:hypothetical protein